MTSSPGPIPSARSATCSASVPVPTPTAYPAPQAVANSRSKASSSGPSTNHPRSTTRLIAASTSAASAPGVSLRNGINDVRSTAVSRPGRDNGGRGLGRRRPLPMMLAADDQREPKLQDIHAGGKEAAEIEELRPPVCPVVVMHRHFGDAKAGVLNLLHHFQADDAAVLL